MAGSVIGFKPDTFGGEVDSDYSVIHYGAITIHMTAVTLYNASPLANFSLYILFSHYLTAFKLHFNLPF